MEEREREKERERRLVEERERSLTDDELHRTSRLVGALYLLQVTISGLYLLNWTSRLLVYIFSPLDLQVAGVHLLHWISRLMVYILSIGPPDY